jgi:hypothetical protein
VSDQEPGRLHQHVRRLVRAARLRAALSFAVIGIGAGLGVSLLIALASASFPLPRSVLLATLAAAVGVLVGAVAGFLRRINTRRLLIEADRRLGSRELVGTAWELASGVPGRTHGLFEEAVIEDASSLLARSLPREMLAPPRLRLAPFLPVLAVLCAAAFLFPLDLRALLSRPRSGEREIASIGEDLRGLGERLEEAARTENLGRKLAIAQDLAQLGRDLASNKITSDDALDRIDQLEGRIGQEYQMQLLADPSQAADLPRSSTPGKSGSTSGNGQGSQDAQDSQGSADAPSPDQSGSSGDSKALSDALNRLRTARDALGGQGSSRSSSRPSGSAQKNGNADGKGAGTTPGNLGAGGNQPGSAGGANGGEGGEPGAGPESQNADQASGAEAGTAPALTKTGTPTEIIRGEQVTPRRVQGNAGEGDSTSFLVRALPEWTGAKLPEQTVRRQYAQAAESALSRDEIPPKLKASVRDYFTDIGMSGGH